jgi:hypothetical protein
MMKSRKAEINAAASEVFLILVPYLVVFFLSVFFPPAFAQTADCDHASAACLAVCANALIFDQERQGYVKESDFQSQCNASCVTAADSCRLQDSVLGCYTYYTHCVSGCPWTVTETAHNLSVPDSDSFYQCMRACNSGYLECDATAKTSQPRPRTGGFDVCGEAQVGCYASCMGASGAGGLPADFPDKCSKACAGGVSDCRGAADASKGQSYVYACVRSCPDTEIADDGQVALKSESGAKCMESCEAGGKYCAYLLH